MSVGEFFALAPNIEGVIGSEYDDHCNVNETTFKGGQPTASDARLIATGKKWRDKHRDKIACQGNVHPKRNWFQE